MVGDYLLIGVRSGDRDSATIVWVSDGVELGLSCVVDVVISVVIFILALVPINFELLVLFCEDNLIIEIRRKSLIIPDLIK